MNSVKDSFSSWDKCMAKTYCKWPAIAAIIVGSLIVLSLVICIGRCLCCGAECACCCFRCCAGCCGGNKKRGHKHLDYVPNTPYGGPPGPAPQPQMWNQQYQSSPQPAYNSAPNYNSAPHYGNAPNYDSASIHNNAPTHSSAPQFATFDAPSKGVHEDSLPEMPSWENATSKKVAVIEEPEAHEMDKLNPNGYSSTPSLPSVASPAPMKPIYSEQNSFLNGNQQPYGGQTVGYTHADSHSGYRGASPNPAQLGYGNQQQYGGSQQTFRNDHYNNAPVSPLYAPSGSTAYEPPSNNQYQGYNPASSPSYGGSQGRKPLNGSWRDV